MTVWSGKWWNPLTWRWVTVSESEFDSEQVAYLRALAELKRDTGAYGELLSEAFSPDADPNNYDGSFGYKASGPYWNWAEKAVGDLQDAYKKELGDSPMPNGAQWFVERVDRGQRDGSAR